MKSIVVNGQNGDDVFVFDNKLLFFSSIIDFEIVPNDNHEHLIKEAHIYNFKYITTLDGYEPSQWPKGIEENLDKLVEIFNFLIEYYRDKGIKNLLVGYNSNMYTINNKYRDIFKTMGFKIPRRKSDFLVYTYE